MFLILNKGNLNAPCNAVSKFTNKKIQMATGKIECRKCKLCKTGAFPTKKAA